MGNLTRATYANQRMTLHVKIAKISSKSGIQWSRYVGNPRGVFSSFMFLLRRLAMPHMRRGDLKTRHFFFPRKGVYRETKCGKRNRDDSDEEYKDRFGSNSLWENGIGAHPGTLRIELETVGPGGTRIIKQPSRKAGLGRHLEPVQDSFEAMKEAAPVVEGILNGLFN